MIPVCSNCVISSQSSPSRGATIRDGCNVWLESILMQRPLEHSRYIDTFDTRRPSVYDLATLQFRPSSPEREISECACVCARGDSVKESSRNAIMALSLSTYFTYRCTISTDRVCSD